MIPRRSLAVALIFFLGGGLVGLLAAHSRALSDEGMWTFDNPPLKQLQERYGFTPTKEWLDHVRLASVRFMDGGSGSFISPNGLVLTNHHVAVGQLQKISSAEKDYVASGFYAGTPGEELKASDLEINVLISMEDVTKRVQAALKKGMTSAEALKARDAEIARIEKESLDKTGLRSDVVGLYHGGEYWLYRYKKYTDIRLVMAPERQAAYFGGDNDNFTYPRYDLDMAFFRVYEDGKPVQSKDFLKWNPEGLGEGDLVFVSGNPGSTDRLYTFARLEYLRDVYYPMVLDYIERYIRVLREYAARGEEEARRAEIRIFGLENSKKALTGEYRGLRDNELMERKKKEEEEFRKKVAADSRWQAEYGDAWSAVAGAIQKGASGAKERNYRRFIGSQLAGIATTIVRFVEEVRKPDAERLPGFHESELSELKFYLLSPAPIYKDLEETLLASGFGWSLEALGREDWFVKGVLGPDGSPEEEAKKLIQESRLAEVEFRKALIDGGIDAVAKSSDPLIALARKLDPEMRAQDKWYRDNIESVLTAAGEKIAQARFAVYGKTTYPDATFTLRLSYGSAVGFPMNGTIAPYKTTLYGLYDRSWSFDRKGDFGLPERFWERKEKLDLRTPVNFVSTCDIVGGNSGSPVLNRKAELVGLVFDGNIESLVGNFVYDEKSNRAVAVHAAYMLEALRKLYDAGALADEIVGK